MTLVKWELRQERAVDLIRAVQDLLQPLELAACSVTLSRRVLDSSAYLMPTGRQDALRALQDRLQGRLAALAPIGGAFNPHVTLGYRPVRSGRERIEPIGWRAERLVLIESWHGASRHHHVASWPMTERQGSFGFG